MNNVQRKMVMQELDDAEKLLSNNINLSTIGYGSFAQNVLPVLATINSGEFDIQSWISIVGHPSVELSVLDDVTGEERYRIPPVLGYTEFQEVEEFNLSRAADEAAIMKNEAPAIADQNLYDHLSKLQMGDSDMMECQKRIVVTLNEIFEAHGIALIPTSDDEVASETPQDDGPEIIGYDLA